ncbi:hypothetical protein [Alysiella crassa]|uniref:Phage protein n=1 Tax=Alysiella crassa TaxID=153491 RepID=A0A376BTH3_9NEIS|nr:hypothetical protein [Alysiella crassa]UOP08053.1 hypothetical protein LVJ80_07025 [Alysiella crassa]SSY80128.1 Uncharacterised protein [Alysiella crassa]
MKHYLVNTPLILQDENGEDVRVERGEIIELSDTQYAEVAAHVTFAEFHGGVSKEEMAHLIDGQPEQSDEHQSETAPVPSETTDKPKRGKTKDAE